MAEYEPLKMVLETEANTKGIDEVKKSLEETSESLDKVTKSAKVTQQAIDDAIEEAKNTSKIAAFEMRLDAQGARLARALAKKEPDPGAVSSGILGIQSTVEKLDKLSNEESKLSGEEAGAIARMTSQAEILEYKLAGARDRLSELLANDGSQTAIGNTIEQIQKLESQISSLSQEEEQGTQSTSRLERALSTLHGTSSDIANAMGGKVIEPIKNFTNSINTFISSIKRIAFYRFVRTIIKDIGQAFSDGTKHLYQWSKLMDGEFAQSMDKIATSSLYAKNSLGAMVAPILNALAPAVEYLTNMFVSLLNAISQVLAVLTGASTWTRAIKYPTEYAKAAGGAAKAAKNFGLAQIDQLTILNKQKSSGGSGFSSDDYKNMFEKVGVSEKLSNAFDKVKQMIQRHLESIFVILSGAALVLGSILLFTGANIPLGLGLMVAGAVGLGRAIVANWDSMTPELKSTISTITGMVGGAFLALGAILAFSGANVPLGIGLMITGAASLATGMVVNWGTIGGNVQNSIDEISGILSGALLGIGGALALSGANVPLGLALMAAGAAGIISTLSVSWNNLERPIQRTVANITTIVSTALLGLGSVLAFSGANVPLGIALMAAGAIGMATAVINWQYASEKVRTSMTAITTIVGMSLLALGAMFFLTGAAAPLGIGMMIAGGVSLASAVAINWNWIPDKIRETLKKTTKNVTDWWSDLKRNIDQKWENFKTWWGNLSLPKFKVPMPHFKVSGSLGWTWDGGLQTPSISVDWYKNGGFPDAGQLFIANEAGPEMVGTMGGRTAVANNEQIVTGIREGVYDAMMSAMQSGSFKADVYIDGKRVTDTVVSNINSQTRRTGSSPLLV